MSGQETIENYPLRIIEKMKKDSSKKIKTKDENVNWKPTNPKDRAATARLDLTLFPATAEIYGALAFTEGDLKYGGYNYRVGGVLASVYVAALKRHIDKWFDEGEELDPVTLVPHLANAIACVAVLIDAVECGVLKDDRPPHGTAAKLLKQFEEKVKHLQQLFTNGPSRFTELEHGKKDK